MKQNYSAPTHRFSKSCRKSVATISRVASFLILGLPTHLFGASYYWDTDKNTSGLQAGSGVWNSDNKASFNRQWNAVNDGSGTDVAWTDNYDAFFQTGGTSVVTLTSLIHVNSITFNGTGYTIAGPATGVEVLALTGAATIAANVDATISARVGGEVGLKKQGTATLTLSGANIYTGLTDVQAGTLAMGASNVFADTSTIKVSGGILSLGSNSDTVAGVQLTAGSITGSGTLTSTAAFDLQAGSVSAILGGSVGANKTTGGTVTLSGVNTYTGGTIISAGTLALSGIGTIGDAAGAVTVSGGILDLGTLSRTRTGNITLTSGAINNGTLINNSGIFDLQSGSASAIFGGTAGLTKTAGTTITLSGANTYTGATTITAGNLAVNGSLAAGSTVGVGTAGTLSGAGTINGSATLTGSGAINLTAPGLIGGTLGVTGGNWNGAGSVSGLTTSSSGTFTIGSGANLTANGNLNVTGGTIAAGSSTSTITGNINYTSSSSSIFAGVIAGSGKTLTLNNSAATLTLGGTNTYTGITSITNGALIVNGSTSTGAVNVASIAKLFGTGTVGGATTVSGIQSAGASSGVVGTQTFSNSLTYASGSIFEWDISVSGASETHDKVIANSVSGSGAQFKITGANFANTFWTSTHNWTATDLFGVNNATVNLANIFTSASTATNFAANSVNGTFTFTNNGGTGNQLTWTVVPESTSALAGILLGAGLLRRKRGLRQSA